MAPGILLPEEDAVMVEVPSQTAVESDSSSSPAVDIPEDQSRKTGKLEEMFDEDEEVELLSSLMPVHEGYV